jgi:hypothetical protein
MVPEIKSCSLIDAGPLETYKPMDPENFSVTLRLMVGLRGQAGEESFDITICTPQALAEECAADGFVVGRHRLVVASYNPSLILSVLGKLIARCDGQTWPEIGAKIARFALWEFEDYSPDQ